MRKLLFWGIWLSCLSITQPLRAQSAEQPPVNYDSSLAQILAADEYGMRTYVMALLKRGPNRPENRVEAARLQQAHMDNINRLAEEGKLIIAGPFLDTGELRGIYLFKVTSLEEAEALTASDPAIAHGSLVMELHPWYGSAALLQIPELHKRIQRKQF
ncbi:MAG: YciI family protein [Bacteroidia bacterium]